MSEDWDDVYRRPHGATVDRILREAAAATQPCTPEEARKIREEYGLLLPEEAKPKVHRGPPRRPTLDDYNQLLEEMGQPPLTLEAYQKMRLGGK